jgi:parallel beta-helix repeat protein/predicted outer membrane repeat protein
MKRIIIFSMLISLFIFKIEAQTSIDQSYFSSNQPVYLWDITGSPYLIMEDVEIMEGSDLQIDPGVQVLFQGHYKMDVRGAINAIGTDNNRIIFTSDIDNPWHGIRFDFSDGHNIVNSSKLHYCNISNAQKNGTNCSSPDPESSGGAIFVKQFSDLEIFECNIFENEVKGQGGAISLYNYSSPRIWDCNFYDNKSIKRGGAIVMMIGCAPIITGNHFTNNSSSVKGGGAIAVGEWSSQIVCNPEINDNTFEKNTAFENGGAIFICNSDGTLENNTFLENSAEFGGGLHVRKNSHVSLINNHFIQNHSMVRGGGLDIDVNNGGVVYLIYCDFEVNSSEKGGGIYSSTSIAMISNCYFNNNSASTDGGAIYLDGSENQVSFCSFEENTADGNGGAIYMNNPNDVPNGNFQNLIVINSFKQNSAYQGSALYVNRDFNYSYNVKVINNLFAENNASDKGVVYFQGNNYNTVFNHNTVTNNTAGNNISGVCYEDDNFFSNEFKNNIIYESVVDIYFHNLYPAQPPFYTALTTTNYLQTNPLFVSSTDYHLSSNSPCINAGNNYVSIMLYDLDANQRIANFITDYGCYEYGSIPYPKRKSKPDNSLIDDKIKVYPNPATEFVTISLPADQILEISIYNQLGEKVYFAVAVENNEKITIPVLGYKPGIYILRLQTITQMFSQQFIVQ